MNEEIEEYYEELYRLYIDENQPLERRYRQLRESLERVVREKIQGNSLQTTDLAARINYVATQYGLDLKEQNQLHTFRLTSNDILNHRKSPVKEEFLRDLRAVAYAYRKMFAQDIPLKLFSVLPKQEIASSGKKEKMEYIRRIRVCFDYADDTYLYVHPVDVIADEPIRVVYNKPGINHEFEETIKELWRYAQLNLLDVSVDRDGIYTPSFIVLEPDYLIDISSLAECYKDYGSHPANYFLSRLVPIDNARPLLLGNIANLFLDEWIHAGEEEPDYIDCMKKAFRQYPIELAACAELRDPSKEKEFAKDCRMHFEHIRDVVQHTFLEPGYNLDKKEAVLEPSYICEALGIQGRLDYMQRDMSSFIEMKSGKADEFSMQGKVEPKENNKVQMLLYMAVLEYSMGQDRRRMHPYLLYTRYPLLYPARASWAQVRRVINLRNRIVAAEYGVQFHNHPDFTRNLLAQINPEVVNERKLSGRFWEQYLKPSISRFREKLSALEPLEQAYFYTLYNFITKELYTSKSGDVDYEGRAGASALWLSTLDEKREAGEILYDLQIMENRASQAHKAYILLSIPQYDEMFLPNFRTGDVVVLYERNNDLDNATNKMVFKGNIEQITDTELRIRLRATQRNASVFSPDSRYAVEHDTMDTTFRSMYLGLSAFLDANTERRELLLGQRPPRFDSSFDEAIALTGDDFERVALKAESARDYFLLVGPPGTGKTSRALRRMVEHFYAASSMQILLLAYTNRAVDEICQSLSSITPVGKFILIGDHKQLPAVILQNSGHSEVHDEGLREAGLFNLKDSLFERLYRFHLKEESPKAIDMLCRQGRMHPGVAFFPNKAFYAGKLETLGLPHQLEHIEAPVRFIPSKQDLESVSGKTNRYEAQIVAGLAKEVYLVHEEEFDPNRTLGVITPYRSQIALIRKELQALAIPALSRISIDTVERYQGSERDVIIYSFCVNHLYQLRFLPNLTEEDGVQIDRKLNVALTRARKQLFITGVPEILSHNSIYQYLLKTIY